MLTPLIIVDNFEVKTDSIVAYCLVDEKDIDFHFTKAEFEKFVDDNDLRERYNEFWDSYLEYMIEERSTVSWVDLYEDTTSMYNLLKFYVETVYLMDAMDIETPIKKICTEGLEKSLSTLERLQKEHFNL